MNVYHLDLPYEAYDDLLYFRKLSPEAEKAIVGYLASANIKRVKVFGSALTGRVISNIVHNTFDGFITSESLKEDKEINCDTIIIGTSPVHYDDVISKLRACITDDTIIVTTFDQYQPPHPCRQMPGTDSFKCVIIYTVHKAASMFLHHLTQKVTGEALWPYYSYYNGNDDVLHSSEENSNKTDIRYGCWGPFRAYQKFEKKDICSIILHLRDPRDILTSMYFSHTYSHDRSVVSFNPSNIERQRWEEEGIDRFVLGRRHGIKQIYEEYCKELVSKPNVIFLKYEEMVLNFGQWLDKFLKPFPIKNKNAFRERLLLKYGGDVVNVSENKYQHKRQIRPGDHKRKLREETVAELTREFKDVLLHLGYV